VDFRESKIGKGVLVGGSVGREGGELCRPKGRAVQSSGEIVLRTGASTPKGVRAIGEKSGPLLTFGAVGASRIRCQRGGRIFIRKGPLRWRPKRGFFKMRGRKSALLRVPALWCRR